MFQAEMPSKTALVDERGSLTYGEFNDKVLSHARALAVRSEKRFILCAPNRKENLIWIYAAVMAGKDLLLVPDFIPAPIRAIIKLAFSGVDVSHVSLTNNHAILTGGGRIATLTSGTTGMPKMVAVNTDLFTKKFTDILRPLGITDESVIYNPAPILTGAIAGYAVSLSAGATIYVSNPVVTAERARKELALLPFNYVVGIPAAFNRIIDVVSEFKIPRAMLATAPVGQQLRDKILSSGIEVCDVYASNETGIIGYRMVGSDSFSLFPGVEIEDSAVRSPYTMLGQFGRRGFTDAPEWVAPGDSLELVDNKIVSIDRSRAKVKSSGMAVPYALLTAEIGSVEGVSLKSVDVERVDEGDVLVLRLSAPGHNSETADALLSESLSWYPIRRRILVND